MTVASIGLDIDCKDGTETEARIKRQTGILAVERRRSASGNLHYQLTLAKAITVESSFRLRRKLGDDPSRILCDRARHRHGDHFDVLYEVKAGRAAGPWERLV